MSFWESKKARGSFVIHFTNVPEHDFGPYGRGYALAAKHLAETFSDDGYADYEAYPIVFLYRHSLELYLKDVVIRGLHLSSLRGDPRLEAVTYDHDLAQLRSAADSVLRACFPSDDSFKEFLGRLGNVVNDFVQLDKTSFVFRYPVNKKGECPVAASLYGNVAAIAQTMNALLEEFDSINFGLDLRISEAEDALSNYLNDLESCRE